MPALVKIKKVVYAISAKLNFAGTLLMLCMIGFTVVDVAGRLLFNKPLTGAYELVEFTMVIVVVLAMSYTQTKQGHMSVDTLIDKLPPKVRRFAMRLVNLLCGIMLLLISWQTIVKANIEKVSATTSPVLLIAKYPFVFIAGAGFALLTLIYVVQILVPDENQEEEKEDVNVI